MATTNEQQHSVPKQPSVRADSPSPTLSPTPAIGAVPDLSRNVSATSTTSHGSGVDGATLGSDGAARTRPSDGSGRNRDSSRRRRGYMRPQVTSFSASAKSRESVMSLGSIAHLQYYFARTGLLDGKGGQLARKKQKHPANLDMAALGGSGPSPRIVATDADSSYASMGSSPDVMDPAYGDAMVTSPTGGYGDFFDDSASEIDVLPPTTSTYQHREKVVPKPPTVEELKEDLEAALSDASKALKEVQQRKAGTYVEPANAPKYANMPDEQTQSWYELQGMHILDMVTLAIRAAKMYYTAHELPDRLDTIKSEKQIRTDLLGVMETLKQMATRNFKDGMKDDEITTILEWTDSVFDILKQEAEIEAAEQAERTTWAWVSGDWAGRELERERAFLVSMDPEAEPLPEWTPMSETAEGPTPFLEAMQNGLRLVKLHNAVVKKSRRRFGAIPQFHTDTQKPYRCADNLRYWVKAAELRFEIMLKVDVMGVVYNNGPEVWREFEAAILQWCRHCREDEINHLFK
ncbi:hypothetical protein N3K66_001331 [Trichothecium roseum]|uniref:Uncharacterized protein n=1 Tax=Trichothecium roseum TaxID=47278 RepID=A0ACC0VEJ6_9HYPO|nr:hypothetical protein N3K66_001331 [Trichothecium roseum]